MPNEPGKTATPLDIGSIREQFRRLPEKPGTAPGGLRQPVPQVTLEEQIQLLKKLPQAVRTEKARSEAPGTPTTDDLKAVLERTRTVGDGVRSLAAEVKKSTELTHGIVGSRSVSPEEARAIEEVRKELTKNLDALRTEIERLRSRLSAEPPAGEKQSVFKRFLNWLQTNLLRGKR